LRSLNRNDIVYGLPLGVRYTEGLT
jgi:hypothetical protein